METLLLIHSQISWTLLSTGKSHVVHKLAGLQSSVFINELQKDKNAITE